MGGSTCKICEYQSYLQLHPAQDHEVHLPLPWLPALQTSLPRLMSKQGRTPCLVVLLSMDYCQRKVRFMEYTCQFARCPTGMCRTVPSPSSKSAAEEKCTFPQHVHHRADTCANLFSTMLLNNLCLPSLNVQARPACTASLACRSAHSLTLCHVYSLWSLISNQLQ